MEINVARCREFENCWHTDFIRNDGECRSYSFRGDDGEARAQALAETKGDGLEDPALAPWLAAESE